MRVSLTQARMLLSREDVRAMGRVDLRLKLGDIERMRVLLRMNAAMVSERGQA
jgi:hypothetical protein